MITIEKKKKKYGIQSALDNIDLVIGNTKITGLIGPNGAGKSTLMKIICGYLEPTSGTVKINDKKVEIENRELRKHIGYLPENNPLYHDMYVKEYLEFVAGIYHIKNNKEAVNHVIALTGLQKEQHKKIGELSKGYKQRVGLAQAIIHDPDVLILDEPTSGLDPNQIIEIRNLIVSLGKNKTVLLSTHILQEVEAICDEVIVINNGTIIKQGKTENIKKENSKNLVVEFDTNPSREELMKIDGVEKVKFVKDNIWIISGKGEKDIRGDIFKFAVDKGMVVLSSQIQEKKLEEIFQEMTKPS